MDINYINGLLKEGKTVKDIREELGLGEKKFQRLIKELGYKYNQKSKQYEYNLVDDKKMTSVSQDNITLINDKDMTIDIQQDLKSNIINLANDYDKIQEVLKWFKNKDDDKGMTEVIEVINESIKINLPKSKTTRTTIRINEKIWEQFGKFAELHKEFNKQDLIAQALLEYMNKFE